VVKIKNPDLYPSVHIHKFIFKFFNSERALTSALITDQIDFAITESDEIAEEIEKSTGSVYIRHRLKNPNYIKMLAFNNRKFPLNVRQIRQALTLAINRKEIFESIFRGQAYFADGPLSQETKNYASEIRGYKHDPRKALQLLMADNWHDQNGDGILDKMSIPFQISLFYSKGVLLDEQIARRIKIDWNKIGVEVKIIPLPMTTIKYKLTRHDYDVILMGYQFKSTPEFFEKVFKSYSPGNFLSYKNKTVDRYFQLYHNAEPKTRKLIFRAIQTQIVKDYPAAFLFFPWLERIIVNTSRVTNYRSKDQKIIPLIHWKIQ
jgi:ABC-type transport system substrate-binding protein